MSYLLANRTEQSYIVVTGIAGDGAPEVKLCTYADAVARVEHDSQALDPTTVTVFCCRSKQELAAVIDTRGCVLCFVRDVEALSLAELLAQYDAYAAEYACNEQVYDADSCSDIPF